MANGFYVTDRVPSVLGLEDHPDVLYTDPLGIRAELARIVVDALPPNPSRIVVAAHGTARSSSSRDAAQALAEHITQDGFYALAAFVDDEPTLESIVGPGDVIVPMFVAKSGHVRDDVIARFPDHHVTTVLGEMPGIVDLIETIARESVARRG